jgi:hypothetical protein
MGFLVELAKNKQFRAGRFFEQFFDLFLNCGPKNQFVDFLRIEFFLPC